MPTLEAFLQELRAHPDGLSLADVLARFPGLSRRTAQRRLSDWVASGDLRAVGEARARRYVAPVPNWTAACAVERAAQLRIMETPAVAPGWPASLQLSPDSEDVLAYVRQDLSGRGPVGWQREFLEAYVPNQSAYLPAPLRRQLAAIGRTDAADAPAGTFSRAMLDRLLIDLSWASSHLEGNTYTRLDTRALIEHGTAASGKALLETQMILNHKAAIEMLVDNSAAVDFDRHTLLNLHSALAENLLPEPADEGRVRQHAVGIAHSAYRPLVLPTLIEEALDAVLAKARQIRDPFEQSFFAMVHLPYLQPFADVNKRVSRLAANIPLIRANLCPLTFLGVPEAAYVQATLGVYEMARVELLRDVYVWAYERSTHEYLVIRQNLAQPDPTRLAWRDVIKATVREVVLNPQREPMALIRARVSAEVPADARSDVQALVVDELRRLHAGVLARVGVRPSEFEAWVSRRSLRG